MNVWKWWKADLKVGSFWPMTIPTWAAGLSTQIKAQRAAKWGGIACLLAAARKMLTAVAFVAMSDKSLGQAVAWTIGASLIPVVITVAGVRLLRRGGRLSGCAAIALIILDTATAHLQPVTPQLISSIIVTALLLIFIANGVRGAFALRHVDYQHSLRETFD